MENIMKLPLREESHTISKSPKPKVRIVHIFAPEIIKTDAANFRDLVQRLTGKPVTKIRGRKKAMQAKSTHVLDNVEEAAKPAMPTCEWVEESSVGGGGYLTGFGEVDGFFQGMQGDHFPLLPLSSSQMDIIGEAHVVS